jgi:hypothetical protein
MSEAVSVLVSRGHFWPFLMFGSKAALCNEQECLYLADISNLVL